MPVFAALDKHRVDSSDRSSAPSPARSALICAYPVNDDMPPILFFGGLLPSEDIDCEARVWLFQLVDFFQLCGELHAVSVKVVVLRVLAWAVGVFSGGETG